MLIMSIKSVAIHSEAPCFPPGSLNVIRRPDHTAQLHEQVARRKSFLDVDLVPLEARPLMH